ncbi:thioredoxin domain-containing protein [Brevundimonas sp. AJA228-03]|uniref:DsbA family protein n=1 Tax=Brevundimonas sp. AJA228-03 TaxID=2752515 RepID=UPI001ADF675C|nr:thioredoxin domain-containing protein [Brevundimonas sp. AJA228-03]QTN18677.1 thioredoxin domain-containing protein [Brevundimonas sp. AJA228-03]
MTDPTPTNPAPVTRSDPLAWFGSGRGGATALAVAVVALGLSLAPYVTGGDFGSRVRAYLMANPAVLDEVVQAREQAEANNTVQKINAAVAANPALMMADARDPSFGPADARVTVIEFFDYRCPGCKAVARDYVRLMEAHPDVRFVFKDWPILDRGNDTTSNYAARAALAAHQQGKYLQVYQALMAENGLTRAAVDRVLAENGVSIPDAVAAIRSPEMNRHLADIHTTGATLGLVGTPTFLINGETTSSIAPAEVLAAIEAAKAAT